MEHFDRYPTQGYAPSAPPLPAQQHASVPPAPKPASSSSSGYAYSQFPPPAPPAPSTSTSHGYGAYPGVGGGFVGPAYFPPGTHPWVIQSFQAADRDGSGSIDETELQAALSMGYQKFSLRTVRLLVFLFGNPNNPSKIGPTEFAALWDSLGQWRNIFQRFDRDQSGEIDSREQSDALLSLGYAVPPSVIQVLISKYNSGTGQRGALNFDSFVECGMIVKGLTEKFKEKDPRYTGSATLGYDTFMQMVIPFLVS